MTGFLSQNFQQLTNRPITAAEPCVKGGSTISPCTLVLFSYVIIVKIPFIELNHRFILQIKVVKTHQTLFRLGIYLLIIMISNCQFTLQREITHRDKEFYFYNNVRKMSIMGKRNPQHFKYFKLIVKIQL